MEISKLVIKVFDDLDGSLHWMHFCYVNKELYLSFLELMDCDRADLTQFFSKWLKEEFCIDLGMTKRRDIEVLKEIIRDKYRRAHPHLFIEGTTDRQGWLRIWVSEHMEKEIKRCRKKIK